MSDQSRRINLTPSPGCYAAIKRVSDLTGIPKGSLVRAWMEEMTPTLIRMGELFAKDEETERLRELNLWVRGVKRDASALVELTVPECEGGDSTDGR